MFAYVALLVGRDVDTDQMVYGAVEIIVEEARLPDNTPQNITNIVNYANNLNSRDENIEYIDMYGYSYMGKKTLWEVSGTEEEGGGLHYD